MALHVALVDNGSVLGETRRGIAGVLSDLRPQGVTLQYLRYDIPFNYSRLNNLAVADCSSFGAKHVVFLNNDVDLKYPGTLLEMAGFLNATSGAGSVGCTLLYPSGRIQHLYIAVGCKIVGAHPFKGACFDAADPWILSPRPVGAATAALLMVPQDLFLKVGGFDERLPSCYQDVDLALKFQKEGRVNWVLPWITAIHHETQTRDPVHSWAEVRLMHDRWGTHLVDNPYNPDKLSRWSEPLAMALGEGAFPWHWLMP